MQIGLRLDGLDQCAASPLWLAASRQKTVPSARVYASA